MFIEIAFIQKFTLFLAHPLYAVAVVLCAFLVFAGLGSRASAYFRADTRSPWSQPAVLAVVAIGTVALVYLAALPPLFQWLLPLPNGAHIAISIALIAPLAFAMGVPFPTALARLARRCAHARSLGVGRERLRVGRRRRACDCACDSPRVRRRRRAGRRALRRGRRGGLALESRPPTA